MMKKYSFYFLLFLFSLLTFLPSKAQNDSAVVIYNKAEADYNAGKFQEAKEELRSVLKQLSGLHKSGAYRLMAICELEDGHLDHAKDNVILLLKEDPYYTPTLNDPQRLIDLISAEKAVNEGITTASRQVESLEESPVPVTLITEEMIKQAGASTLQELLCLFVPGMSNIEGMEANIAMHGIYGLNQDKILFLQDGHRLNGGSTNAEAPDYRNSLDKIKQIEVLRGPASSLYGNVALTAVVNIITRTGGKMNGGRVSGSFGTQNTFGGSFVVGGGNNVVDILGWGSVNSSKGFKHVIQNDLGGTTTLYSNGYFNRPSYDVGIKAKWGEFSMTVSSQRSKKTPYINVLQLPAQQEIVTSVGETSPTMEVTPTGVYNTAQNFNYDSYSNVGSNGPGLTRINHHINLDWAHDIGKVNLQASGYISMENTSLYNVMGDSIASSVGTALLQLMESSTGSTENQGLSPEEQKALMKLYVKTKGVFQVMDWENVSFGGMVQATLTKYQIGKSHGTALAGVQYDHFALTNAMFYLGGNYTTSQMISSGRIFSDGKEDVISGFAQLKHYFNKKVILNGGLRYDFKKRFNGNQLNHFSPRLSVIYKISPLFSMRGACNYSFVDAPYIYRACNVGMFSGGSDMKPEKMTSLQLSLLLFKTFKKSKSNLQGDLTLYYNSLSDLITTSIAVKDDVVGGYLFVNTGKVKQGGADLALKYTMPGSFFVNFNATWQRVFSSTRYSVVKGNRVGIPQFMGNIVAAWSPYHSKNQGRKFFSNGRLWLNLTANMQSTTYYQQIDLLSSYLSPTDFYLNNERVAPRIILGVGATYEWKGLELNVTAKNLTNDQYKVCSMLNDGIPHAGRQILGKITVKF